MWSCDMLLLPSHILRSFLNLTLHNLWTKQFRSFNLNSTVSISLFQPYKQFTSTPIISLEPPNCWVPELCSVRSGEDLSFHPTLDSYKKKRSCNDVQHNTALVLILLYLIDFIKSLLFLYVFALMKLHQIICMESPMDRPYKSIIFVWINDVIVLKTLFYTLETYRSVQ